MDQPILVYLTWRLAQCDTRGEWLWSCHTTPTPDIAPFAFYVTTIAYTLALGFGASGA